MFDKDSAKELYTRKEYSFAESLYENYIKMRQATATFENPKYGEVDDSFINSKEGKEGFLAGVYIMFSLISDL